MDFVTLIVFLVLYAYGFSLMIWAAYFDKRPSKLSVKAAKIGLVVLICTVLYFLFMFGTGRQTFQW